MKVKYQSEEKLTGLFSDLFVGDTFFDTDGNICIKTSYSNGDHNAICFVGGGWMQSILNEDDEVTPVDSELNVLD